MKNRLSYILLSVSLAAVSGCTQTVQTQAASAADVPSKPSVQLVAWSDFHSAIYEDRKSDDLARGGLAVFMAAAEKLRGDGLSILLDGGDMFQGAMPFNESKGKGMIDVMNALRIDAATLGNHEFDYGPSTVYPDSARGALKDAIESSNFPWVNANITAREGASESWPPSSNLKPYVIIQKGPYRIAVVGVIATETPIATSAANVEGIEFQSISSTLTRIIPEVAAENPDFTIVEAHITGTPMPLPKDDSQILINPTMIDEMAELAALPAEIKSQIDLVVAGHSHESFIAQSDGMFIIQNKNGGREITSMTLVGDDKGLRIDPSSIKQHFLNHKPLEVLCTAQPQTETPIQVGDLSIIPDKRGNEIIEKYEKRMTVDRCEILGCLDEMIARNYGGECPLGNLVADAMKLYFSGTDAAFQNAGGVRIDLPKGNIYRETLSNLMPFDNYNLLTDMTGEDIIKTLKISASGYHGATKVSGIQYQFEPGCKNPEDLTGDGKIDAWENNCLCSNVLINGRPVQADAHYKVAVSDFMFNGGDDHANAFTQTKIIEKGPFIKDVLFQYVKKTNTGVCLNSASLSQPESPRIVVGSCGGSFAK